MFNPIVDMALVNKVMGLDSNNDMNVPTQVPNKKRNHSKSNGTKEEPIECIGFTPYRDGSYINNEFHRDARTYGVQRDKKGNYIVYKYGSYRRSVIIIGIIIIFLQLCILGNL